AARDSGPAGSPPAGAPPAGITPAGIAPAGIAPAGGAPGGAAPAGTSQIVPGPPGGVLDLRALAAIEERLQELAHALVDHAEDAGARSVEDAEADRAAITAASTIATALWFDTL